MIDLETSQKIIVLILVVSLFVAGILRWLGKMKVDEQLQEFGVKRITRSAFYKIAGKRRFSCMQAWIASSDSVDHYCGIINGYNTCIFTIAEGRYTTYLTVLITSLPIAVPHFIIRPMSFTREIGDLFGVREQNPLFPPRLTEKYDVSSDDDSRFAAILTPEIIDFFMAHEGVWVEVLGNDLMIRHPLKGIRENYPAAISSSHGFAALLSSKGC